MVNHRWHHLGYGKIPEREKSQYQDRRRGPHRFDSIRPVLRGNGPQGGLLQGFVPQAARCRVANMVVVKGQVRGQKMPVSLFSDSFPDRYHAVHFLAFLQTNQHILYSYKH